MCTICIITIHGKFNDIRVILELGKKLVVGYSVKKIYF